MGTRGLICVVKDKKYKVAQYNQFDSYPSGQGADIVRFLETQYDPKKFASQVDKIKALSADEIDQRWNECGATGNHITSSVANRFKEKYPQLVREFGFNILNYVQETELPEVALSIEFAGDGLFCEWAYVIDLDKSTFEVYTGFGTEPIAETERFYFLSGERKKYYPVNLVKSFSLNNLPPANYLEESL